MAAMVEVDPRAEGYGASRNDDGILVMDKPTPTVKYMKRFIKPGLTLLKFGSFGQPHERVFRLAGDMSTISYQGGWISKFGRMITIPTAKITRIQKGQHTPQFQRMSNFFGVSKDSSLHIEFRDSRGREKTLNVIAPTPQVFEYLNNCLTQIVKKVADKIATQSLDTQYVEALWTRADKDKSGTLNKAEIISLIQSMNIDMPTKTVSQMFEKVDENKSGDLSYDEFLQFLDLLRDRPELKHIFNMIANDKIVGTRVKPIVLDTNPRDVRLSNLTLEQFQQFWRTTQGQDLSVQQVIKVCEIANPELRAKRKLSVKKLLGSGDDDFRITYSMFCNIMIMPDNDLFDLAKSPVYQDMKLPLSYYYISSSHNTYLEGDQLGSNSSIKKYIDALTNGCRCVELDVWDGKSKDKWGDAEPIITHGHTLTGYVLFKDVIQAINDYGFENNPFPIILSLEQHCGIPQQQIQAKIMKKILGDRLLMPLKNIAIGQSLPSPHELQGKVILKGKRMGSADSSKSNKDKVAGKHELTDNASSVAPELSAITYLGAHKVKTFDADSLLLPCDLICSYSENDTIKFATTKLEAWIEYNKNHLSRVFPSGLRVDSSNYVPTAAWSSGCQCVALNFQTSDEGMHIAMGKFRENGGIGYVLKPESMINPTAQMSGAIRLTINVLSGSQLPKPRGVTQGEIIDPFVKIAVWGESQDDRELKTHSISDNGFNPLWNKVFTFDIKNPDTAILSFRVMDEDNASSEFVGFQALPIACLRPGVRVVQLCDEKGKRYGDFSFAQLMVWVGVEDLSAAR